MAIDPHAGEADRLAQLVGSRLCHDLANPLGAIANGVELLQMAGAAPGSAELQMVSDAVAQATARLRFLRVAFGAPAPGQLLPGREVAAMLAVLYAGGRLGLRWEVAGDQPRDEVKLAFLGLQCVEAALPRGGDVVVARDGAAWRITARADRVKDDPALWATFRGGPVPAGLRPAEVQFALAPRAAAALGRSLRAEIGAAGVTVSF